MSNKKTIENSLKSLILDDDRAFVAMLSGEWGIGKTYFWNEFTRNHLQPEYDFMRGNPPKNKDVVYISLFGKNSLQDIETEIVTKLYRYNKGLSKYTQHLNTFGNMASKAIGLPLNISAGSLLSLFKASDFKHTIICFDDFERLSKKVSLKDVMGLISQFKEQKKCKVIMILNEGEISKCDQKIYSKNKEKIVDFNFNYMPSQDDLFEAIKDDIENIEFCEHQTIYDFFKKIENIRIMKQALYQINHFDFIKNYKLDAKVINEFVEIALNLFVFKAKSNYSYSEFDDFRSYIPYDNQVYNAKIYGDKETKIIKNSKHESNLNYYDSIEEKHYSKNKDILERNIYTFIDTHKINEDELQDLLNENNRKLSWYSTRNEISEIHNRFFTDFSTCNNKLAEQLFTLISEHKDEICHIFHYDVYRPFIEHINEFSSEISIESLKTLEEEIAEKYIAFYVANPDDDQFGPLDEKSYLEYIGSHYPWAKKSIIQSKKNMHKIDPKEVLSLIEDALKYKRISDNNFYKLKQISAKDYESLIKETPYFIQPLVKFLKMPNSKDVRKNIIDALKSLKDESDDYAWKVGQIAKASGIKLEEDK